VCLCRRDEPGRRVSYYKDHTIQNSQSWDDGREMGYFPRIIQGGMGAGVSDWRLARAVSKTGQLGVVSGVALDQIFARRLQNGDPGGHMRRALDHLPFPAMAERIWNWLYIPGGKRPDEPYKTLKLIVKDGPREIRELCLVSNFVEVWLAREGHNNPVGINYLEKVQMPHLPSAYGAMLAGVSYVLMGAGIPLKIPGMLDKLALHQPATYPLEVDGAHEGDDTTMRFDPRDYMECELPPLKRPAFLAIIASNLLSTVMLKRADGRVDGFVVEGPTAGGHNAPPRGKLILDEQGEAVYGERDRVDLAKMRELGVPFWLAGGYGSPDMLNEALSEGATGVQVGTPFAYCGESGLDEGIKYDLLQQVSDGRARVVTDLAASPTNFPFKVSVLADSFSESEVYDARARVCDLGYLRSAYKTPDGKLGYRCAAEPVKTYVAKGGKEDNTAGRKCLCNALMANIGMPQLRPGCYVERALVTSGNDIVNLTRFLPDEGLTYTAADVVAKLLQPMAVRQAHESAEALVA
jgi:nitronate monooxygenase